MCPAPATVTLRCRRCPVPDEYVRVQGLDRLQLAQAYIVAHEYEQLLRDLRDGRFEVDQERSSSSAHSDGTCRWSSR